MRLAKINCLVLLFTLILAFISLVDASVIRGNIYGPDLSVVNEAQIRIYQEDRVVESLLVKNGHYSINLEPGNYDIEGSFIENGEIILADKEIIKVDEGEYNIDLILLPISNSDDLNSFDLNTKIDYGDSSEIIWFFIAIFIFAGAYLFYRRIKKSKKKAFPKEELSKDLKELIEIIQKAGGRINQIDLRRQLSYSEAKVSLMIAELENFCIVKKIKKGRGNILILEK